MNASNIDRRRSARLARARRLRHRAAYTVVEVMMALSVLAIGATGVIAMQKATIVGNTHARNMATANAIAQAWIERLQVDGMGWQVSETGLDSVTGTQWLNVVGLDYPTVAGTEGIWFAPPTVATGFGTFALERGADVRGLDADPSTKQSVDTDGLNLTPVGFCTHLRITQVMPNLIRAEVRVFWERRSSHQGVTQDTETAGTSTFCADDAAYVADVNSPLGDANYHFVHMVTGITRKETGP